MRVDNALRPARRSRSKGDGHHVILVRTLGREAAPVPAAQLHVMPQPLEDSLVERAALRALGDVGVQVDQDVHIWVRLPELLQQRLELAVDNHAVHLCEVQDIVDILLIEAVIHRHTDSPSSRDAVDALEEGRGVGGQDADALEGVLEEVVREAARAVGELRVGAAQLAAAGGDVVDGLGIGLDGGGAREEEGRREVVDVRGRRLGGGEEVVEDGAEAGGRVGHGGGGGAERGPTAGGWLGGRRRTRRRSRSETGDGLSSRVRARVSADRCRHMRRGNGEQSGRRRGSATVWPQGFSKREGLSGES